MADEEKPPVIKAPRSTLRTTRIPGWVRYRAPQLHGHITVSVHRMREPLLGAIECMVFFPGDCRGGFDHTRHTVEFAAGPYRQGYLYEYPLKRNRAIGLLFLWNEGEPPSKVKVTLYAKRAKHGSLDEHIGFLAQEFRQFADKMR